MVLAWTFGFRTVLYKDLNDEVIADVVDPTWQLEGEVQKTYDASGKITATMNIVGTDKYFKEITIEAEKDADGNIIKTAEEAFADEIQLLVDGIDIVETGANITKTLSTPTYLKEDRDGDGVDETTYGVKYTLTISGLEEPDETFFNKRSAYNDDDETTTGRVYREYSGTMQLVVPANSIIDESGNTNPNPLTIELNHVDTLKPEVIKVSSQNVIDATNVENSKQVIVFDIVDKYLSTSAISTTDTSKIHVYVDGELTEVDTNGDGVVDTDTVTKTITNIETLTAVVGSSPRTVGYRYTLELSNFEKPRESAVYGEYTNWSGDVSIKIDANTAVDTNGTGNDETIMYGNEINTTNPDHALHADFIKPDVTYKYAVSAQADPGDINYEGKTFQMVFELTDKHFVSSALTIDDLTILIDGTEPTWRTAGATTGITKTLTSQAVTGTVNGASKTIGTRYTLTLSNLEQLQVQDGEKYLDYSGVISVAIPAGTVDGSGNLTKGAIDEDGNLNDATTITSGVDLPGGTIDDDSKVVDVVDPIWQKDSFSTNIHTKTATIVVKGTDKYLDVANSTLTSDKIKLFVNGTETTGNITVTPKTVTKASDPDCFVTRTVDGTAIDVQVGVKYTITVTDFPIDANQVKIRIAGNEDLNGNGVLDTGEDLNGNGILDNGGTLLDTSGNDNKVTEFMVYNALKLAGTVSGTTTTYENSATSAFLGNSSIQRQNIENVTFLLSTATAPATGTWDVSAQQDNSIIAWAETSNSNGALKVYIASNEPIYGNRDSSYLFSSIGYAGICTATETITNINLLNTSNVVDMTSMFVSCGYIAMTSLDLGDNFDTSNVTSMKMMFYQTGYTAMTSLDLGDKFDASNVTNMNSMFNRTGYTALTSLDLGDKFYTSKVTDMTRMFERTGYTVMISLDIGENFDTSSVTNMEHMFFNCGYTSLTSLNLGDNFDTSNVTSMKSMFYQTGYTAMTSLDLGEKFDTSNVTDMNAMFFNTGYEKMTTLNLGEKFDTSSVTDMSYMFYGCGYTKMTSLDLKDKFFTSSETSMLAMFANCGYTSMKVLDLGPAFTNIAEETEYYGDDILTNCGALDCTIYVSEQIYSDMTHVKLDSTSTTTIEYTRGTINPIYKPEWEKTSSAINETTKTMTINIKGSANKTFTNGSYTGTYLSDVTSPASDFTVYIDGEQADSITKSITVGTPTTNATTGKTEIQATITLSNFEEALRQLGKNFKEWSGNVAIQMAQGTISDIYSNKNRAEIDVKVTDADGNETTEIQKIEMKDTSTDKNTNGTMFADYIKPEFTYKYSNTDINYNNKTVTVVFDVTDKYFDSLQMTVDQLKENITVAMKDDATSDVNSKITKTLAVKTIDSDVTDGNITYKTDGSIYYNFDGTSRKIGTRFELVISNLQQTPNDAYNYSGPISIAFPSGVASDKSGNTNNAKTITIGIDEDGSSEAPTEPTPDPIVDVVDPLWVGPTDVNQIVRNRDNASNTDTVNITLLGVDKYYETDIFAQAFAKETEEERQTALTTALSHIKVYVDDVLDGDTNGNGTIDAGETATITKTITKITDTTQLQTLAENAGYEGATAGYTLTLGNFGDQPSNISGKVKIVIDESTIEDTSGNTNVETTIDVGNIEWEEANEPLGTSDAGYPRYTAFRNNIVDFIKPQITYTYSTVEGSENPDIDYEQKTVTVKFTVTDKYLLGSDLIETTTNAQGETIQIPKNMSILVDGETVYENDGNTLTADVRKVTTSITSTDITDTVNGVANTVVGKEYTLVVSNIQQVNEDQQDNTTPENGDGFDFSGPMQIVFAEGAIDDKSGNKNAQKTITLDTEIGDNVVDVVDPVIYYAASEIDRLENTVTLMLRADDKYLTSETLVSSLDNIQVKVVKPNGTTVTDRIITKDANGNITSSEDNPNSTITKTIIRTTKQSQYMMFKIVISNFGEDEGVTSVIIPKDTILDTSGNGNVETEILVGSESNSTAFKDSIVDFTKPIWRYNTSSIQRTFDNTTNRRLENAETSTDGTITGNGTVTLEVKGTDIYFDDTYYTDASKQLNLANVKVYVNGVENTSITKTFATNADGTIKKEYVTETAENGDILKGVKYTIILGNFETNDGTVKIEIPANVIKDTSLNANIATQIDVGNTEWVETDEPLEDSDANYPKYTAFRNNFVDFIKPEITLDTATINRTDNQVQISFNVTDTNFLESNIGLEDLKIFVDDDYEMQVYGTGANADTAITASITQSALPEEDGNGIKYTLTLSGFEQDSRINGEMFLRHSGRIRLVIAQDQVYDTSGNPNNETTLIVNEFTQEDNSTIEVADFVKPIIYYNSKYVNWEERTALITLRATDRFYDTTTQLQPSDLILYEEVDGNYIQINDFNGKIDITRTQLKDTFNNILGYDYVIKLNDFEEEFKMKVVIPANKLGDTSGNYNEMTEIEVVLDNQKPRWEYVSSDTTQFESDGKITFNVKGVDKFLDIANSGLSSADPELRILKDGVDITSSLNLTVTYDDENSSSTERSKAYKIEVTGLTDVGTYSLLFEAETLVDEFDNKSAAKTITFSKSAISPNTGNYVNVTYHISPDFENVHNSYVHELMAVNETGTNYESSTYYPSSLGELNNHGENPLFAEPIEYPNIGIDGFSVSYNYNPQIFAGWAEADEKGNIIYYTDNTYTTVSTTETTYTRVYGLYDKIPNTITNLKALWEDTKLIFVSSDGNNSNDGKTSENAVKTLEQAISMTGTNNNVIVIMDEIEWNSSTVINGNVTITSLYAGVDYREQGAELKISSNMVVNGDITFDNIKLYSNSTTVSDGTDYLGNGTYSNMLISNYSGDITLGRGVTTPTGKYTFGAIIGGNYKTETSTGELGTHTIRVEAGKYNNIIAGSTLTSATTTTKSITHEVIIGNPRDTAVGVNDNLTITGYVAIGENEQKCYPSGATSTAGAASRNYVYAALYSGILTGDNKFAKVSEDATIYLRSINGTTDGLMDFIMYGGIVNNNIYGGASATTYTGNEYNYMTIYGGQLTGNIFGQSANDTFNGASYITIQGNFSMTGNVFGGSNITTTVTSIGTGSSIVSLDSSSATINGNIYGGSKSATQSSLYIDGTAMIEISAGTVNNVYGGGYNCDISVGANVLISGGNVIQNIYGGGYQGQVRNLSKIYAVSGNVQGNIYGGSHNTSETQLTGDTIDQDINIYIGVDENGDISDNPSTINGTIYGGGLYDKIDTINISLVSCANIPTVYGGSNVNCEIATVNIALYGMTVNEIYGGGQSAGLVGESNINLTYGTVTDVYGGGYQANVTTSNIILEGTTTTDEDGEEISLVATVGNIYGGSNTSGTVTTSNITLTEGNLTNVYGGGNSASVGTANVTLNGITIDSIHGGSKDAGITTTSNVILTSGTATNVFGGGLDVGVTTSNVTQQGTARVTNIYGGNDSGSGTGGDTGTSNVKIINSSAVNVYGGNYLKGTTRYANITIQGTSTVSGNLFGGGFRSAIGKSDEAGSTTIKLEGGTIIKDINGGSLESTVYGDTNIKVGIDATGGVTSNAGSISIAGNIYGGGTATNSDYTTVTVRGNTHITIDDNSSFPITFHKSIFGSGNGTKYYNTTDGSTIDLKDLGTSHSNTYELISVERTGELRIGNSYIEMLGRQDKYNYDKRTSYTLNKITDGLVLYNSSTLYTRRGFNMVGGFGSYKTLGGSKQTVTISGSDAVTNGVDNRLYTLEGINLVFAKQEGYIYEHSTEDIWGDVNGMAFFGMYAINRSTGNKQYDIYAPNYTGGAVEGFFANGTYVEGRHKTSHDITTDGFYTNVADYDTTITVTPQIIQVIDYGKYYDWIIGADVVNYNISLIASPYGRESIADLLIDYKYEQGATYTLNRVSTNALNTEVNLIDSLTVPTISGNANTTFGLTMETTNSGWLTDSHSNIYTDDNGSFDGDTLYASDKSASAGTIRFKITNSTNISETKDLGNMNIILTGKTDTDIFFVVIAVNIQTIAEDLTNNYEARFTDFVEDELDFTNDSKVDLTYTLYNESATTPYETGDYRVISSTVQLPTGTRLTLKDYGQGDSLNKIYYYHVTSSTSYTTETKGGVTRYIYRLSEFVEMGSTTSKYADPTYFHSTGEGSGYIFEKYDLSIDFGDSNIAQKLANETYLELRKSTNALKYDNGSETIKYNLYSEKNAVVTETISNNGQAYSIVETLEIPFTLNASMLEQDDIMDTKYYDKISGIALEIVNEQGGRIQAPELQNFKLTNANDSTEYYMADSLGVIRVPIMEGLSTFTEDYKLSIAQANVAPGLYTVKVYLFTSDDGEYYGDIYSNIPKAEQSFQITFISRLLGLAGVEATDDSRIINKETGKNTEGNNGVDMTISIADPTSSTNIRVELYKRNPTYTDIEDETTYSGTTYTLVDITQYLEGAWETPSTYSLTAANAYEYMVSPKQEYETTPELETIEFERAIKAGIATGEYKLEFKAYHEDTLVQTVKKTFLVTN